VAEPIKILEERKIAKGQATADATSVASCFERTASLYGGRVAVACALGKITYTDLNQAANRLAHRLAKIGGVGDRVAVLMPQDRRIFIGMLAALKTGRVFVILNAQDPPARLAQLLDDADPVAMLTVGSSVDQVSALDRPRLTIIDVDEVGQHEPAEFDTVAVTANDTATLVYTSGSTGQPKGVVKTHGMILRDAFDVGSVAHVQAEDRVMLVASLWGGQAQCTTWFTLLAGASLLSFPVIQRGFAGLADWMSETHATIFISASSLFRQFMKAVGDDVVLRDIRLVKLSSDPATRDDFELVLKHFPNAELMHAMGLSEIGHVAYKLYRRGDVVGSGPLPLGRPFAGVDLQITDEAGRPCSHGTVGTLTFRLPHLAAGYWRDPERTAENFFSDESGARGFRSGDRALLTEDGLIALAGRKDATYKVRGQRVDIAEVERNLARIAGISELAAVVGPRANGELQLVAFIVPESGCMISSRDIRASARLFMPRHLVPSLFVLVDALPRAANGKLDRATLRDKVPSVTLAPREGLATTDIEKLLSRIWSHAFELEGIGCSDDFFELGGDSLIATVISAQVYEATGVDLDFGAFVERPVLSDFAAFIDECRSTASGVRSSSEVPKGRRPAPISRIQQKYWEKRPRSRHTIAAAWHIEGALDVDVLNWSINAVIARHEMLRTRFDVPAPRFGRLGHALGLSRKGTPHQYVEPVWELSIPFVDLSGKPDADARLDEMKKEAAQREFDLTKAPPLSFTLIRLKPNEHVLLESHHHIISDGPSWNIFGQDLANFYEARLLGEEAIAPLDFHYSDYACWESERLRKLEHKLDGAAEWWARQVESMPPAPEGGWLAAYKHQGTPGHYTPTPGSIPRRLEPDVADRLSRVGRDANATYLAVRLATLLPICSEVVGHETVLIGSLGTARTRTEFQRMFGPLFNFLTLPLACDRRWSFRDLVRQTQRRIIETQTNTTKGAASAAFAAKGLARIENVLRVRIPTYVSPLHFAGLTVTRTRLQQAQVRDVFVMLGSPNERELTLQFDAGVFSPPLMGELFDRVIAFIEAAARDPDGKIEQLMAR